MHDKPSKTRALTHRGRERNEKAQASAPLSVTPQPTNGSKAKRPPQTDGAGRRTDGQGKKPRALHVSLLRLKRSREREFNKSQMLHRIKLEKDKVCLL
mmetsp:Transcript_35719/g.70385  ORF Transcript_35719/g.70385 Transcript_35719/m.70385 type:complete len:98 (-) Transcript_35719:2008-2301(-)